MRKYLLPALVCAAAGALVLLLLKRGETTTDAQRDADTAVEVAQLPAAKNLLGEPAETPTRLDEHRWLRELQRALEQGNLSSAMFYRQKACEDMETVLASEKLTKDLLDTIRKHGLESDDPARRDVVIPMLRVVEHPEATRMIGEEYYRARNEGEQMTLLEAMSKPFHDPKQASVWAVDKALNSDSAENRERAFDIIRTYVVDNEILIAAAVQVYGASTDEVQRQRALKAISERGHQSATAREFTRRILRNPRPSDLMTMVTVLDWGDENDAARLEQLADEFPAMGEILRQQARMIRQVRADEQGRPRTDDVEERRRADAERARLEEEERKKREEEGGPGGDEPVEGGG